MRTLEVLIKYPRIYSKIYIYMYIHIHQSYVLMYLIMLKLCQITDGLICTIIIKMEFTLCLVINLSS